MADFLGVRLQLHGITDEALEHLACVEGPDDGQLKYTHFSLLNEKTSQRRFPVMIRNNCK